MSEEIIKILDALADKFGIAIDWTSSNVLPYLQQLCTKYVRCEIATSIIWLIVGIVCFIFARKCFMKGKESYADTDEQNLNRGSIFYIICAVLVVTGAIISMTQIFDIVTCISFPEKLIINELQDIYSNLKAVKK